MGLSLYWTCLYVLLPFHLSSAAKQCEIVLGTGMHISKDAIQILTSHQVNGLTVGSHIWAMVKDASPKIRLIVCCTVL